MADWLNALIRDTSEDDSSDDEGADTHVPSFVPLVGSRPALIGGPTVSGHRHVDVFKENKVLVASPTKGERAPYVMGMCQASTSTCPRS